MQAAPLLSSSATPATRVGIDPDGEARTSPPAADHSSSRRPADLPAFRGEGAPGPRCLAVIGLAWVSLVALTLPIGLALGDSTAFDRRVSEWFVDHRSPMINTVTRVASLAGDTYAVLAIAALVVIVGIVRRRTEGLVVLVVGMLGEVTIFLTLTALISRARPDVPRLDAAPPTSSFPSGHTFAAIVLWGTLAVVATRSRWHPWLRTVFVAMMVIMPVVIGISRLSRGMHHATDVLASCVLGSVWLTIVIAVFPNPCRERARVPAHAPAGEVSS
jgi:membrane-associated phospholipid phosphatase